MRALIISLALAVGGFMLGGVPAHGQSITGLGQADQQINLCHQPLVVLNGENCGSHGEHEGGGRGKN
jgi:hypothetical protein